MTTIKVSSEVRDVLKSQARKHGRTLGDHLRFLADDEGRRERFQELRRAMAESPPDKAYTRDALEWQSDAWS